MTSPVIVLEQLSKTYLVPERESGVMAAARSLVQRRNREIKAVDQVSFAVEPGSRPSVAHACVAGGRQAVLCRGVITHEPIARALDLLSPGGYE